MYIYICIYIYIYRERERERGGLIDKIYTYTQVFTFLTNYF